MEITIKRCGYKVGSVGWLAAGIAGGSIKIHDGITKSQIINGREFGEKHGLWIKWGEKKSMCLALFNPYSLSLSEFEGAHKYQIVARDGDPAWSCGDEIGCTEACWESLLEIAQAWIDHITEERGKDKKVKITIKFA